MAIVPKNWSEFQHYKDRSPPWIKLHRGLLDNYEFHCLPDASRALAPMLWLLASDYTDGKITLSTAALAFRFRLTEPSFREALKPLVDAGFFTCDSASLADRKHDARPEAEGETQVKAEAEPLSEPSSDDSSVLNGKSKKRNEYPTDFEDLWKSYPTDDNMSKKEAFDVWKRLSVDDRILAARAVPGFRDYCRKNPTYRPIHLCRFLSKRRFDGFASPKAATVSLERYTALPDSPEFMAWKAYAKDQGRGGLTQLLNQKEMEGRAFSFETRWPPGHKDAA